MNDIVLPNDINDIGYLEVIDTLLLSTWLSGKMRRVRELSDSEMLLYFVHQVVRKGPDAEFVI